MEGLGSRALKKKDYERGHGRITAWRCQATRADLWASVME
jgi:hypothetical protein